MDCLKKVLKILKIKHEIKIVSAHRTPKRLYQFAETAEKNKISVIVAGAGGFLLIVIMIVIVCYCCRKKSSSKTQDE